MRIDPSKIRKELLHIYRCYLAKDSDIKSIAIRESKKLINKYSRQTINNDTLKEALYYLEYIEKKQLEPKNAELILSKLNHRF